VAYERVKPTYILHGDCEALMMRPPRSLQMSGID